MKNEYLNFAKDIALKAKEIILKYYNKDKESIYKDDDTVVTKADREINSYLIERVKEFYPQHSIDGEEEQFGKSNYVWVCDPIDGTAMYTRNIPTAVFSLALVIDGVPEIGVVYDPFSNDMYTAIKGNGAYKNDKLINVNNYHLEEKSNFAGFAMWPTSEYNIYDIIKELGKNTWFVDLGSTIRMSMGVATGDFIFMIFPGTKHKNCDIAAVKVIVEEAGGKVTDFFGNEQRYDCDINGAIISNNVIHEKLVELIKEHLNIK